MRSFFSFVLLGIALGMFAVPARAADKLRVAVLLPLTGDAAGIGESFKNGMTLGIEKLSPKAKDSIEFVYEDDKMLPRNAVSAFNQLNALSPIDVLVTFSSGTSNAVAPLAESKKMPMIAIASDAAASRGRRYVFNLWVTPEAEARVLLEELKRRGHKRVARIGSEHDGTLSMDRAFDAINKGEIKVVLDEHFPLEMKDFRSYVNKLRQKQNEVDAVIVALFPGQLSVFGRQLKEAGVKTEICGFETFEDINDIKQANGAYEGAWYVSAADSDGAFLKQYRERFPNASSVLSASGNDTVLLIGKMIDENVGRANINEQLSKLKDFQGAMGTYSATGDQRFSLPAALKVITKDGFENLKR